MRLRLWSAMVFGSVRDKALSFSGCSRVAELGCCTRELSLDSDVEM